MWVWLWLLASVIRHLSLLMSPLLVHKLTHSADPWRHLLRRYFPSMAAPGAFPGHQQQHQIFRRTARELLGLRISGANPAMREKREVRRLEEEFRNQYIILLVSHPIHDLVAEAKIPIIHSKSCSDFLRGYHPLILHRVLPVSEYEHCEVSLQMPGGLELMVNRDYRGECNDVTMEETEELEEHLMTRDADDAPTTTVEATATTTALLCWSLAASERDTFALECAGYLVSNECDIHFPLSFTCAYSLFPDERMVIKDVEYATLHQAHPAAVVEASIRTSDFHHSTLSSLEYLKLMENWLAVARQRRSDVIEFARLQSRFEGAYLLVEVGARLHGLTGPDPLVMGIVAFALVPLADEAALLALFDTKSTCLQFIEGVGVLPPPEDCVVYISMVDLKANRVEKLSKVQYKVRETDEGTDLVHVCIIAYTFHSFEQRFVLNPSIEQEVAASGMEDGGQAATVMLAILILNVSAYNSPESFSSILELWKFFGICLTGNCREY